MDDGRDTDRTGFPVEAFLERTVSVGDEPSDIAFLGMFALETLALGKLAFA